MVVDKRCDGIKERTAAPVLMSKSGLRTRNSTQCSILDRLGINPGNRFGDVDICLECAEPVCYLDNPKGKR